ncbi:MAG: hypothetical protein H7831_00740 [Magnetococcus sp. WYHC-3]
MEQTFNLDLEFPLEAVASQLNITPEELESALMEDRAQIRQEVVPMLFNSHNQTRLVLHVTYLGQTVTLNIDVRPRES